MKTTIAPQANYKKTLPEIYSKLYKSFGPQHWWPGDTPFEISVGAILTQNTNWTNVEKAIRNLKENNVLTAGRLHKLGAKKLASLIRPSGYFNVKAGRLKNYLSYLSNHYNGSLAVMRKGDTQTIRKELLSVNGIGPETADSILLYALEKPVFVIDAYTEGCSRGTVLHQKTQPIMNFRNFFMRPFPLTFVYITNTTPYL